MSNDGKRVTEIWIHARAAAPLETTWALLADQRGMAAWAPVRAVTLEREGDPAPDGVGAIRVVRKPPLTIREQVTAVERPTRLAYRLLSGLPVRDYVGETILSGGAESTEIAWRVTLTPRFPGVTFLVRRTIRALANGLADAAERPARQSGPSR